MNELHPNCAEILTLKTSTIYCYYIVVSFHYQSLKCKLIMHMHQPMWIPNVPPPWEDPGDSDIWKFLLSKSPPSFEPLCQNPFYFLLQGWGSDPLYLKCQNCSGLTIAIVIIPWMGCQKAVRIHWVTHNTPSICTLIGAYNLWQWDVSLSL